jgi:hypothetical protein
MERCPVVANTDHAWIGVGCDLKVVFEPVIRGSEHEIDSRIDPAVAYALEMGSCTGSFTRAKVIDGLASRRNLTLRIRLEAGAHKSDVCLG